MCRWLKAVQLAACVLALGGCAKRQPIGAVREAVPTESTVEIPHVNASLELMGSGLGRPTVFTFEQLARMEMTRLEDVMMLKSHEPDETTSWEGPSLQVLLTAAQIKPGPMSFTVVATDGYGIECAPDDLESTIVALKDGNGRWLAEIGDKCPLRLVPPNRPGNYWVMYLSCVTVEPVGDPQP